MTKKKRILAGFALGLALVAGGVGYSKWQTAQDFRAYINSRQWVETRKDYSSFAEVEVADDVIRIKDESVNSRGGQSESASLRHQKRPLLGQPARRATVPARDAGGHSLGPQADTRD